MVFCCKTGGEKVTASFVLLNGNIWTGNPHQPKAEALAIAGNKIIFVGTNKDGKKYISPKTEVVDAEGKFICPGFTDAHLHFLDGGQRLASVELRDAGSPDEFKQRIADYIETLKPGTWVIGGDWDHTNWGGELPHRSWIDDISPDNPVWISRLDGHMALANSKAMEIAGVTNDVEDIEGGTFVRDEKGYLTGIMKDNSMSVIESIIPDPDDDMKFRYLDAAMKYVNSKGVTSVHHMGNWDDLRIFELAKDQGKLTVRINAAVPISTHERLKERKETKGWGDVWVKLGGLKGFIDGSLGSHTALMKEAFSDAPKDFGLQVTETEEMYEMVKAGDAFGGQAVVHAIGDRANNIMLDIFEKVARENGPRDRRFRIEHAQHLLPEDITRFGELGVIASMQPYHCIDDGRWAEPYIGKERMKTTHAYRSLLDAGTTLVFGSDWYVAPPTPLEGIYAAATRATLDDENPHGWIPEQKISVEEALKAYTVTPAYASFEEDLKGTLEPGKLADIVILEKDILAIPPVDIWDVKVETTIVGGKIVYKK
ncbi:MAG: amidohydrolase [Candidatus Marinimicrobia bacterium]|nr:amidohydrolase [Candidatus Neomarinimicrobiota bacterium]